MVPDYVNLSLHITFHSSIYVFYHYHLINKNYHLNNTRLYWLRCVSTRCTVWSAKSLAAEAYVQDHQTIHVQGSTRTDSPILVIIFITSNKFIYQVSYFIWISQSVKVHRQRPTTVDSAYLFFHAWRALYIDSAGWTFAFITYENSLKWNKIALI